MKVCATSAPTFVFLESKIRLAFCVRQQRLLLRFGCRTKNRITLFPKKRANLHPIMLKCAATCLLAVLSLQAVAATLTKGEHAVRISGFRHDQIHEYISFFPRVPMDRRATPSRIVGLACAPPHPCSASRLHLQRSELTFAYKVNPKLKMCNR